MLNYGVGMAILGPNAKAVLTVKTGITFAAMSTYEQSRKCRESATTRFACCLPKLESKPAPRA